MHLPQENEPKHELCAQSLGYNVEMTRPRWTPLRLRHMSVASQIAGRWTVRSTYCLCKTHTQNTKKQQSSASLAFCGVNHPVEFPVQRKVPVLISQALLSELLIDFLIQFDKVLNSQFAPQLNDFYGCVSLFQRHNQQHSFDACSSVSEARPECWK